MITGNYHFADKTVEVNSIFNTVHLYCKDYISEDEPDFAVTTDAGDIEFERSRDEIKTFTDGYYEELAVYRKICEKMPLYDTFLFHGSVIAVDGKAFAFAAPSGTGKSTHAALWRQYLGDRVVMVNDDKPLIKIFDEVTVYGTPYDGKHRLSNKIGVPLKAVCLLERSDENRIEKMRASEAFPKVWGQVYHPSDKTSLAKTLDLINVFMSRVEFYKLQCNMDIDAAKVAYDRLIMTD